MSSWLPKLLWHSSQICLQAAQGSAARNAIRAGLTEAVAHAKTKGTQASGFKRYQPHPVDVSSLRKRLSLTQEQFAVRFGFSVATLRHWERGDCSPSGTSLVLLNVINRNPTAVL